MKAKTELRKRALELRNQGLSYSEILKKVPVSKSTLSSWLPVVHLNKFQKQKLKEKLQEAQRIGAAAKRRQRVDKTQRIRKEAISEIDEITNKQLFYMGTMLYWAEGSKEREDNISQQVAFTNSDPLMCKLFLKWVRECLKISDDRIVPSIYMHISRMRRKNMALKYWSEKIEIAKERFRKISFTKTRLSDKNPRKDSGRYYGQLRIRITKSTDLNREISGWIEGICLQAGAV